MNQENVTFKELVGTEEQSELNMDELMEVQGGVDSDEDLDFCIGVQCKNGAVKVCYSGA